jgi:uncharacterized membrane protein YdbT with pleckstrin-like domain
MATLFAGFPVSLLADDEDLVVDLRPHPMALIKPLLQTIAIALAVMLAWLLMPFTWGWWFYALTLLAAIVLFLAYPSKAIVSWGTSHFVVTTDRVIRRTGWIAKESMEISLDRVSDVRFKQSMLERLLGAGDLFIESAGRAGQEAFEDVRDPERVKKVIFEMKDHHALKTARKRQQVVAGGPVFSVADELSKLHQLMTSGVLSEEEFLAVKSRILDKA